MLQKILQRRSCRNFLDKPVEIEKINKLKEIINTSPTAHNKQDFSCVFSTDATIISKMAELAKQEYISQAKLFIVFFADANRPESETNWWEKDTMIAATIAMVGCEELELASCLIGRICYHEQEVKKIFKANDKTKLVIGLAIGYAKTQLPPPKKTNRCYDNIYNIDLVNQGK